MGEIPTDLQPKLKFDDIWPAIDGVKGYLVPGQERWLYDAVRNLPKDAVIVEIGSYMGRSTTAMGFACSGTERHIYAIDTFAGNDSDFIKGKNNVDWDGGDYLSTFKNNLLKNDLLQYVTPMQGTSSAISESWNKSIDFLFVDGSHEYEDVVSDFEKFFPWLKPGGLIAFHDVQPEWKGPSRAWNEIIRHQLYRPSHFFSIAYGSKPHDGRGYQGTVHTIIPVHNRRQMTFNCLRALHGQTIFEQMKIYVVDDGSTDDTAQMIADEFPKVTVYSGDGNLWWTGGVRQAISTIRPDMEGGDFFLLVNNDSTLNAETVEVLVRESTRLNRSAIAPIALCGSEAISTGWGEGSAPILNDFERQFKTMFAREGTLATKSIFGRCSLYPSEILDTIGNFDAESFPHYHGDTDFALRAGKKGLGFFITGCTCIRVREDKDSTGSHHEFRKGPQAMSAVLQNMTSIKSIDNVKVSWRYFSRHNSDQAITNTLRIAWRSLKYWYPVFRIRSAIAPLAPLGRAIYKLLPNTISFIRRSLRKINGILGRLLLKCARIGIRVVSAIARRIN